MKIIIAGGTGRVGEALTEALLKKGHQVVILSRKARTSDVLGLSYSKWDPAANQVDSSLSKQADAIVNLSGASIAQRWTEASKREILSSRIESTKLLSNLASQNDSKIRTFINASAIGFYAAGDEWKTEEAPAGDHFMAKVCSQWEDAVQLQDAREIRKIIIRIGVVLEAGGGALKAMSLPFKLGLGAALGSGKQYMSVIHLDDLIGIILLGLEQESIQGVYNATMTKIPTNKEFSKSLAKALNRPFFLPAMPAFVLRLFLGETAESVLLSFRLRNEKIRNAGYSFKYPDVDSALQDIYK